MDTSRLVDRVLEGSVVGSFSRLGHAARSRTSHWTDLSALDLTGRTIAITGPTSGLGLVTSRSLRTMGAHLVLIARNADKLASTVSDLRSLAGPGDVHSVVADMGDLDAVRGAASSLREFGRIDVLVHNAGALTKERLVSPQGIEMTIASHVLGPFLLTALVRDMVNQRIVTVSSGGMYAAALPDLVAGRSLEMSPGSYDGTRQYAIAKRAQVTLNEMWAEKFESPAFYAMHPGWADTPGVQQSLPLFRIVTKPLLRNAEEGADSIIWLAAEPQLDLLSGSFVGDRVRRPIHRLPMTRRTDTAANRSALWSWCVERCGVTDL
ncbi:MAG: SDR family NAD(P)-dependent oxidoreductase [Ilumatobacteraceae bacterium]